jgi:hypothetical protein
VRRERSKTCRSENIKERDNLRDVRGNGGVILRLIIEKYGLEMWI